ncbi:MAG: ribose-5-phosphate isomerase RpiA [Burkholderiaceae bacterium]
MNADDLKKAAARVALERVQDGAVLGVGTGSTVNHFIDLLPEAPQTIVAAVSSSEASTRRLSERGIPVISLDDMIASKQSMPVYVDGADEVDSSLAMIKGGGGALTREKIIAQAADKFVCIVDQSKIVSVLGKFPLPVEIIPMAVGLVAERLRGLGGVPTERAGFVTDNGNSILDVAGLHITDPVAMEQEINQWPGVVTVGLFAQRGADECLVASTDGVKILKP